MLIKCLTKHYKIYMTNLNIIITKQYQGPLIFEENPNIATAVDKGYSNPEPSTGIATTCKGNLDHHLKIDGVT